MENIRDQISY